MTLIIILVVMAFVFFDMGHVVDVYYRSNNHNCDNMITVMCYGISLTLICVAGSIVA